MQRCVPDPTILVSPASSYPDTHFIPTILILFPCPAVLQGEPHDPYANHMDIQIEYHVEEGGEDLFLEFLCDLIIDGVTAAAEVVAPELAPEEIFADVELDALCADAVSQIGQRR